MVIEGKKEMDIIKLGGESILLMILLLLLSALIWTQYLHTGMIIFERIIKFGYPPPPSYESSYSYIAYIGTKESFLKGPKDIYPTESLS